MLKKNNEQNDFFRAKREVRDALASVFLHQLLEMVDKQGDQSSLLKESPKM
jgi:hypothetical protein